jgi:hypothetical protein
MLRALAAVVAAAAVASAAEAPPAWTAEAIRTGSVPERLPAYTVPGLSIEYTTPFLRVARAANKAFREKRPLTPETVDPRTWTPELRVLVGVLPVAAPGRAAAYASPRAARLTIGAAEVKATRMETATEEQAIGIAGAAPRKVKGGVLRAVFEIRGTPPPSAELEIRYAIPEGGREREIVERVALDFRKSRW